MTGTLIEATESVGEVYREVALDFGVELPAWRLDDAFRRVLRHAPPRGLEGRNESERRTAEVDWWTERIRQTFQATDSTIRFDDFGAFAAALFETYRAPSRWRVKQGVMHTLESLVQRGSRLAIASGFDHRGPTILEGLGLRRYFDPIELPYESGERKPNRAIFERIARAWSLGLETIHYVGDDSAAILCAIEAHGLTVWDARHFGRLDFLLSLESATEPADESFSAAGARSTQATDSTPKGATATLSPTSSQGHDTSERTATSEKGHSTP